LPHLGYESLEPHDEEGLDYKLELILVNKAVKTKYFPIFSFCALDAKGLLWVRQISQGNNVNQATKPFYTSFSDSFFIREKQCKFPLYKRTITLSSIRESVRENELFGGKVWPISGSTHRYNEVSTTQFV
jgi:hypothetical protein